MKAEMYDPAGATPNSKAWPAKAHNHIPLMAGAFADLETPINFTLKLASGAGGAAQGAMVFIRIGDAASAFGRYSFIGLPAHHSARERIWRCAHRSGDRRKVVR